MKTGKTFLDKAGLLFILLLMVIVISPSVLVPVSAQEPNPTGRIYLPLVIGENGVAQPATAGESDDRCGRCTNPPTCTEREFYDPDNPTNCQCTQYDAQDRPICSGNSNCTWWVLYQRPDLESSTIVNQWNQYNTDWDWQPTTWLGYAERSGYWVDSTPRVGAIAVFNAGAQGAGPLGHVAYVTGIADEPPTKYSSFTVTEMNCCREDLSMQINSRYYADNGATVHFIYAPGVYLCTDPNGTGKCRRFAVESDTLSHDGIGQGIEPGGVTSTYLDFEDLAAQGLYWNNATSSVYVSGNYWAILWENELAGGTARRGWGGWWLGVGPKGNSLGWSDHIDNLYDHPAPIFNDRTSAIFVWKKGDPQIPAANLSNTDGAPKEGVYMCPDGWFRNGDPENPMYCYNFPVDAGTSCTRYDIWWWGNGATSFWILGDYEVWVRGINDWSKNETFNVNDAELWQPSPGNRIFNDDIGTFEVRRKGAGQAQALGTDGTEFKITENPATSTEQTTQQMTAADTIQGTACSPPAPLYAATWLRNDTPTSMTVGNGKTVTVNIRNDGSMVWERDGATPVHIAYHWLNTQGGTVVFDGARTSLPRNINPGESTGDIQATVNTPQTSGTYILSWSPVKETVAWFDDHGVPSHNKTVNVCPYTPGQGSSRQQLFLNAYNRNGGMSKLGCATSGAYWWGPVVAQNFEGSPGYDEAVIFQDEPHDNPPMTVPAYVVHGGIWYAYRSLGGPQSFLGPPASDEYFPPVGDARYDFGGGYIVWNGGNWQAIPWNPDYAVTWLKNETPTAMGLGQTIEVWVNLRNEGILGWQKVSTHPTHLTYHWVNSVGQVVIFEGLRTQLPFDLSKGQSTGDFLAHLQAPPWTGVYTLRWTLVHEGITWFENQRIWMSERKVEVKAASPPPPGGLAYGAVFLSHATPTVVGRNTVYYVSLNLRNTSSFTWERTGPGFYPVHLAYHWVNSAGQTVVFEGLRTLLPGNIPPGGTTGTLAVIVHTPGTPGTYVLQWTLVHEGVTWFESRGVPKLEVWVTVQ